MKMTCRAAVVGVALAVALVGWSCAGETELVASRVSTIGGMPGPEDLAVDCTLGYPRLLVSSVDRLNEKAEGAIFVVELGQKTPVAVQMLIDWDGEPHRFRPHGMALVNDRLFVINHGGPAEAVEVFRIENHLLHHEHHITGSGIVNPNDLDARRLRDGSYELFITNPPRPDETLKGLAELLIGPRYSFVTRLRTNMPTSSRIRGFRYANGVAVTPSGRLHVASSIDGDVFSYPIDATTSESRSRIELDSLVDNITVEDGGTLLVAAGKSAFRFGRHASGAGKQKKDVPRSPTMVWRVHPGPPAKTTLLFEDDGSRISGGSSAVCIDDHLYIGQVFGDYVLRVAGACARGRR